MASTSSHENMSNHHGRIQETIEALESGAFVSEECLDELARDCKGDHECEITFEGGDEDETKAEDKLLTLYNNCEKNPGHPSFIPVSEFKIEHLPKIFRKERVMRSIQYWMNVTVKIIVRYFSTNRPDTYPNSKKPYPSSRIRGSKRARRIGTGNIYALASEEDWINQDVCPCHLCEKLELENRERIFWTILVETSKHVIFDSSEAKCSIFECFYDSDSTRSETVKILYGYEINEKESKIDEDLCQVKCVTHDRELAEKLKSMTDEHYQITFIPQYKKFLAILISHPHGCSKRITVGQVIHLIVPVGWEYPVETPLPSDDTFTCRLPLYPWSKMPLEDESNDDSTPPDLSSSQTPQSSSNPSVIHLKSESNNCNLLQNDIPCLENLDQSSSYNSTAGGNSGSSPKPWDEDPDDFIPVPGTEFLLPVGTTFTLPKDAKYAFRFPRLDSTYFFFPPGTKFTLRNGKDVFFPPEAQFSMYMLSARVSYVSYTVDSCQGSSGAGVLLDGGERTICCTFPHSGQDNITEGANRSGLQAYSILPKSLIPSKAATGGKEGVASLSTSGSSTPVIRPHYVRFEFLAEQ